MINLQLSLQVWHKKFGKSKLYVKSLRYQYLNKTIIFINYFSRRTVNSDIDVKYKHFVMSDKSSKQTYTSA